MDLIAWVNGAKQLLLERTQKRSGVADGIQYVLRTILDDGYSSPDILDGLAVVPPGVDDRSSGGDAGKLLESLQSPRIGIYKILAIVDAVVVVDPQIHEER